MPVIYSNYKVGAGSGASLGANLGLGRRQVPGPQAAGMDPGGASCSAMAPGHGGLRGAEPALGYGSPLGCRHQVGALGWASGSADVACRIPRRRGRFPLSHRNCWGFFIIGGEGTQIAATPGGSDVGAEHPRACDAAKARFVKTWVGFSLWLSSCMSVCDIIKLENRM